MPSGLIGPGGDWSARCPADGGSAVIVADIDDAAPEVEIPVFRARAWRRTARAGNVYAPRVVQDPRSADRSIFQL